MIITGETQAAFEIPLFVLRIVKEEKREPGSRLSLLYCVTVNSCIHTSKSVNGDVAALFFSILEVPEKLSNAYVYGSISVSVIAFNMTPIHTGYLSACGYNLLQNLRSEMQDANFLCELVRDYRQGATRL